VLFFGTGLAGAPQLSWKSYRNVLYRNNAVGGLVAAFVAILSVCVVWKQRLPDSKALDTLLSKKKRWWSNC